MADLAKRSSGSVNLEWSVGDCISVQPEFFGDNYAKLVPCDVTKIYGRVKKVITNRLLVIWDADGNESYVSMGKVSKEPIDTEQQVLNIDVNYSILTEDDVHSSIDMVIDQGSSSVVTLDDYQPSDQSTSTRDAAESDAIRDSIDSCKKSKGRHRDCKPKTFSTEDIDTDTQMIH